MTVDLFEFARTAARAEGDLAIAAMTRVDALDREGAVHWSATGAHVERAGTPAPELRLALAVDGTVTLRCQRCMEPMRHALAIRSRFVIVADEAALDAMDPADESDDVDAIAGAVDFDLDGLVEDEVILALPLAPRHAACPPGAGLAMPGAGKASPFAALAVLKGGDDADRPH